MPTPRKTTKAATPKAAVPAAGKAPGLSENTILLAALAVANDGTVEIPFSAFGEVLARRDTIRGVTVVTGASGLEVSVDYHPEEEDTTNDVAAVQETVKSAYTPAGNPASQPATRVGPAVDRPSFTRPADALANTGA